MYDESVLFVDLNNFAHYPTIPVGSMVAVLRGAGFDVRLFSPLSIGVSGFQRQKQARIGGHMADHFRFWSAMTHSGMIRTARGRLRQALTPRSDDTRKRIIAGFAEALADEPDVVLVSAYTMYYEVVGDIAELCAERGIPLIVGGAYFNEPSIARQFLTLEGVSAIVAGEVEACLADLVAAAAVGAPLDGFPGVSTSSDALNPAACPLLPLENLPIPDYTDFPWQAYSTRIIPLMTSRGCKWGACQFCSDVTTVMGRTFRSQKLERAIEEVGTLAERHQARHLVFHDLKLNSDLQVWHGLIDALPGLVKDAVWTCAVHAGAEKDNGLCKDALKAARAAGLARMTTGLESGSQKVLKAMGKGTDVGRIADFCRDASEAGISVRLTVIVGFPGETISDLRETAHFLQANGAHIERVMVNRFSVMMGTPIAARLKQDPARFPDFALDEPDLTEGVIPHRNAVTRETGYYRALFSVLRAAHKINRQPLRASAQSFEGVM